MSAHRRAASTGWWLLLPSIGVLGIVLIPLLIAQALRADGRAYAQRVEAAKRVLERACFDGRSYSSAPLRSKRILQRVRHGEIDRRDLEFRSVPARSEGYVFSSDVESDDAKGFEGMTVFLKGDPLFEVRIPVVRVRTGVSIAAPRYHYLSCLDVRGDDLVDYFR